MFPKDLLYKASIVKIEKIKIIEEHIIREFISLIYYLISSCHDKADHKEKDNTYDFQKFKTMPSSGKHILNAITTLGNEHG